MVADVAWSLQSAADLAVGDINNLSKEADLYEKC